MSLSLSLCNFFELRSFNRSSFLFPDLPLPNIIIAHLKVDLYSTTYFYCYCYCYDFHQYFDTLAVSVCSSKFPNFDIANNFVILNSYTWSQLPDSSHYKPASAGQLKGLKVTTRGILINQSSTHEEIRNAAWNHNSIDKMFTFSYHSTEKQISRTKYLKQKPLNTTRKALICYWNIQGGLQVYRRFRPGGSCLKSQYTDHSGVAQLSPNLSLLKSLSVNTDAIFLSLCL